MINLENLLQEDENVILADGFENAFVGRQKRERRNGDGVAISRRFGDLGHADLPRSPRFVFYDKGLPQPGRELLPQHASQHVHPTSGWQRHDYLDGLARILGLRRCMASQCESTQSDSRAEIGTAVYHGKNS